MKEVKQQEYMDALVQLDAMSARLAEHQTRVEVMSEMLDRSDADLLALIQRLQDAAGLERANVEALVDGLRSMRYRVDMLERVRDILAGASIDPSEELLRNLSTAFGIERGASGEDIVRRGMELAEAHTRAAALYRENIELRAQLAKDEQ